MAVAVRAAAGAVVISLACPSLAVAFQGGVRPQATEAASSTIAAGARYQASPLHRWFAGSTYRDLWATPIRVPVLDLRTFAGGLHPTKAGGGMQTKSLRLKTTDGLEYVFRLTDKSGGGAPGKFRNTPVDRIFQDQVSAMHPAGAQVAVPIMAASGILHPSAVLMVMADDSLLGQFRQEFGGRLGIIEEFPNIPDRGPGFGGASKIIDSEDLLKLLNADATQRIDARAFLTARLTDLVLNDNDRHKGNWKWAQLETDPRCEWTPIARDRDHAFVAYDGMLLSVARLAVPTLVSFGTTPSVAGLTQASGFDARLLSELERPVWDSVSRALQARITDSVIHAAVRAMPVEYRASSPKLEAILRARRDALPSAADRFYRLFAARVDVHGTDAADRAVISRVSDGSVDVRLESRGTRSFARRFDARETSEILVYLHDGDDTALVTGHVQQSILVRVIGGNGTNVFVDSSTVSGDPNLTRFYDAGTVHAVSYGPDTLFDRRPWEMENGVLTPPHTDHGASYAPLAGLSLFSLIGVTPRFGLVRYGYGFDQRPYATMVGIEGEYAFKFHGARVILSADKRLDASSFHVTGLARMSDLDEVNFHGLGNATIDSGRPRTYYEVHQRQWSFAPAIALAVGQRMDISLGPVILHSVSDSARSPYLAATRPYGFGTFDETGATAAIGYVWHEPANDPDHTLRTVIADITAAYFPAALSVRTPFEAATATIGVSFALPLPTRPLLVVRAGGKKVYGDFPFFEAATIGGEGSNRYMDAQRYVGDASLYASSELRIPVARLQLVLPLRVGILGLAEAGRVYDRGSSPGSWHPRTGEGIWVGMPGVSSVLTLVRTTEPGHAGLQLGLGLSDIR